MVAPIVVGGNWGLGMGFRNFVSLQLRGDHTIKALGIPLPGRLVFFGQVESTALFLKSIPDFPSP